ncbi:unnamed protein product, partial [Porites evermanni]
LQLCCAIDKLKEEQTARINCTRTCAHLTKDLVRTQLSYESGNCTDAMFKAKVVRILCVVCPCLFALLFNGSALNSGKEQKRQIRRRCMISTQQACYKECLRKLVNVNWTGYKLIYAKGYDYDYYCCRDLNKVGQFKP